MKTVRKHTATLNLPTLKLEGGSLFLPDVLEKAALGQARLQAEADYGIPKGLKLKDEYSRAFQIACAQWRSFAALLDRTDFDAQRATATFVTELLRDAFGYVSVGAVSAASSWGSALTPSPIWPARRSNPFTRSIPCPSWWPRTPWAWTKPTPALRLPAVAAAKRPHSSWPRSCSTPARTTNGRW
jgi:hypothetical protein